MEDGAPIDRETQRIEVELISHAEVRDRADLRPPWTHGGTGDSSAPEHGRPGSTSVGDGDRRPDTVRARMVAVAAVTAVVALLAGWMLGRAGGSDDAAPTATVPRSTTTPGGNRSDETLLPGEPLPGVEPDRPADGGAPVTTRGPGSFPAGQTSTVPAGGGLVAIAEPLGPAGIDPALAGLPYELIGISPSNRVQALDLVGGELTEQRVDSVALNPTYLYAGDGWILVPGWDLVATLIPDDGAPTQFEIGDGWNLFAVPGTDRFWRSPDASGEERPRAFLEIDHEGNATGEQVDTTGLRVIGADPLGGLIAESAGGVYGVGPDGPELLAEGQYLGVSADRLVVARCDDRLRCSPWVIDRATGDERRVPTEPVIGWGPILDSVTGWGGSSELLSPDGRFVTVIERGADVGGAVIALVDLDTARIIPLTPESYPASVVWSSDSSVAFFLDAGRPTAFLVATGEIVPVAGTTTWSFIALRDASVAN